VRAAAQCIDVASGKAINEVEFYVPPLYNGKLTITASFKVASPQRVDITYENSTLVRPTPASECAHRHHARHPA